MEFPLSRKEIMKMTCTCKREPLFLIWKHGNEAYREREVRLLPKVLCRHGLILQGKNFKVSQVL